MIKRSSTPGRYQLGAPIALDDLLALPADGCDYTRDEHGRLALMTQDDHRRHRGPLSRLTRFLNRVLDEPWHVVQEGGVTSSNPSGRTAGSSYFVLVVL